MSLSIARSENHTKSKEQNGEGERGKERKKQRKKRKGKRKKSGAEKEIVDLSG
jgi:hypothetical protein